MQAVTPTLSPLTPFCFRWRKRPESAEAVATNMETAPNIEPIASEEELLRETEREKKEDGALRVSITQIADTTFATASCCVPTPCETRAYRCFPKGVRDMSNL